MQNIIPLIFGALVVYLVFFRKGGMGCCGNHGSHSGHGNEPDKGSRSNVLYADIKEDVIDLREDQYTVVTVEEGKHPKAADRTAS